MKYQIMLHTPLGKRSGTMDIHIKDGLINGCLNILGNTQILQGKITPDGKCLLQGKLVTLVREIFYQAVGEISQKHIDISLECNDRIYQLTGFSEGGLS